MLIVRVSRSKGSLLGDISITFFANVVSLVLGALSVLILPKFLSEMQYGYYQLYQFYVGYGSLLAFGIPEGLYLLRGAKVGSGLSDGEVKNHFLTLCILDGTVYIFILFVAISSSQGSIIPTVAAMCCASGFISCVRLVVYYILQTSGQVARYARSVILERVVSLPPVLFAVICGATEIAPLLAFDTLGRLAAFIYSARGAAFMKRSVLHAPWRQSFQRLPGLVASGGQILISRYADTLISGAVRYGVQIAWGVGAFAHVSLTMNLVNMFMRLADAVAVPVFPALRGLGEDGGMRFYRQASFGITALIGFGVLLLIPATSLLVRWVPAYSEALPYAILLAPMCLAQCKISVVISNYYKSLRLETPLMVVNVTSILVAALCAFVTVIVGDSLFAALVAIDVVSLLRLLALEGYLTHFGAIPETKMICCDVVLCVGMVLLYVTRATLGLVLYLCFLVGLIIANRTKAIQLANYTWSIIRCSR